MTDVAARSFDRAQDRPFRMLSLDAGGGGHDLGIRLAVPSARTVCYVEREVSAAAVLAKGIEAGLLDDAPIWSDHNTFDGRPWRGKVDCVAGGIPCQPFSAAGKRLGPDDPRDGWPNAARLVWEIGPGVCFFENVASADLLWYYWTEIRPCLQAMGYEVAEGIFSAEGVGAPHLRERLFWLAYRPGLRWGAGERDAVSRSRQSDLAGSGAQLADGSEPRGGRLPDRQAGRKADNARRRSEELSYALDGPGSAEHGAGRGASGWASRLAGLVTQRDFGLAHPLQSGLEGGERGELAGQAGQGPDAHAGRPGADDLADSGRRQLQQREPRDASDQPERSRPQLADAGHGSIWSQGCHEPAGWPFPPGPGDRDGWERWLEVRPGTEPAVRRDANGLAFRADRLRVLGNGVVPVVAADALLTLAAQLARRMGTD